MMILELGNVRRRRVKRKCFLSEMMKKCEKVRKSFEASNKEIKINRVFENERLRELQKWKNNKLS